VDLSICSNGKEAQNSVLDPNFERVSKSLGSHFSELVSNMNDDDEEQVPEDKKITQRFKHLVCKYVIEKMSTVNPATGNREWQPSRISIPDFEKANKEASEEYSKERDLVKTEFLYWQFASFDVFAGKNMKSKSKGDALTRLEKAANNLTQKTAERDALKEKVKEKGKGEWPVTMAHKKLDRAVQELQWQVELGSHYSASKTGGNIDTTPQGLKRGKAVASTMGEQINKLREQTHKRGEEKGEECAKTEKAEKKRKMLKDEVDMSLFQSATENANLRHEYHLRTAEVLGQQGGEMIAQKIHKNGIAAAQAMLASPHCTQEQRQFCEKYLMDFMKSSIQYFSGSLGKVPGEGVAREFSSVSRMREGVSRDTIREYVEQCTSSPMRECPPQQEQEQQKQQQRLRTPERRTLAYTDGEKLSEGDGWDTPEAVAEALELCISVATILLGTPGEVGKYIAIRSNAGGKWYAGKINEISEISEDSIDCKFTIQYVRMKPPGDF